jgi:hypothetical protein
MFLEVRRRIGVPRLYILTGWSISLGEGVEAIDTAPWGGESGIIHQNIATVGLLSRLQWEMFLAGSAQFHRTITENFIRRILIIH